MTFPKRALAAAGATLLVAAGVGAATLLTGSSSSSSAASSCEAIGYQSGVAASMNRLRKLDPGGTNTSGTGAYDKLQRTLSLLVYDHDRACGAAAPPPSTTTSSPPPTTTAPAPLVAPQTYNKSDRSDARYCTAGLPSAGGGHTRDAFATYDENGLQLGGRSENDVPGLRRSDNMNSLGPCDGYQEGGRSFPPWPAESYNR